MPRTGRRDEQVPGMGLESRESCPAFHSTVGAPFRLNVTMWNGAE